MTYADQIDQILVFRLRESRTGQGPLRGQLIVSSLPDLTVVTCDQDFGGCRWVTMKCPHTAEFDFLDMM